MKLPSYLKYTLYVFGVFVAIILFLGLLTQIHTIGSAIGYGISIAIIFSLCYWIYMMFTAERTRKQIEKGEIELKKPEQDIPIDIIEKEESHEQGIEPEISDTRRESEDIGTGEAVEVPFPTAPDTGGTGEVKE